MTFTALRDAAPLPPGPSARRFFGERIEELAAAAAQLPQREGSRAHTATRQLRELSQRAARGFAQAASTPAPAPVQPTAAAAPARVPPSPRSSTEWSRSRAET